MDDNNSNSSAGGIGLVGLVFIVFLVLKLCHVIDWSWWWVTAPLWIPFALIAVILLGVLFCCTPIKIRIKRNRQSAYTDSPRKSRWQRKMDEMMKDKTNKPPKGNK